MKCPFCGKDVEYSYRSFKDGDDTVTLTVGLSCRGCGAETEPIVKEGWGMFDDFYFDDFDWEWNLVL